MSCPWWGVLTIPASDGSWYARHRYTESPPRLLLSIVRTKAARARARYKIVWSVLSLCRSFQPSPAQPSPAQHYLARDYRAVQNNPSIRALSGSPPDTSSWRYLSHGTLSPDQGLTPPVVKYLFRSKNISYTVLPTEMPQTHTMPFQYYNTLPRVNGDGERGQGARVQKVHIQMVKAWAEK